MGDQKPRSKEWEKLYLCTHECMHACVHAHVRVCMCAWSQLLVSSFIAHHFTFLKQDLWQTWSLLRSPDKLASEPPTPPPAPLTFGYRYMRSKLESSVLLLNYLIHWAISQALRYYILTNTYLCRNTIDWSKGLMGWGNSDSPRWPWVFREKGILFLQCRKGAYPMRAWDLFRGRSQGEKDFLAYVNCFISAVTKCLQEIREEGLFSLSVIGSSP